MERYKQYDLSLTEFTLVLQLDGKVHSGINQVLIYLDTIKVVPYLL